MRKILALLASLLIATPAAAQVSTPPIQVFGGSGNPGTVTSVVCGKTTITTTGTCQRNYSYSNPNNPTGASTTYLMMGLGSGWTLTPTGSDRVKLTVSGSAQNSVAADGVNIKIAYGTGTAPVNGATATGTIPTNAVTQVWNPTTGLQAFNMYFEISGLSNATAYWFDLQVSSNVGGTASVQYLSLLAEEATN